MNKRMNESHYLSRSDAEDIVLYMADIVLENRALCEELKEMRKYKDKYHQMINDHLRSSEESNKELLKDIFEHMFSNSKAIYELPDMIIKEME